LTVDDQIQIMVELPASMQAVFLDKYLKAGIKGKNGNTNPI